MAKSPSAKSGDQNTADPPQTPTGGEEQTEYQGRYHHFMDSFDQITKDGGVDLAVAIVVDPTIPGKPIVYVRGHRYEATALICDLARRLKAQIINEITV